MSNKRVRAIAALKRHIDKLSDVELDDLIRPILGIRPRPSNAKAWGWLADAKKPTKDHINIAAQFIKEFEGCHEIKGNRVYAYPDPRTGGVPYTIGYGNTRDANNKPFRPGQSITMLEAENLFLHSLHAEFDKILSQTIPYWSVMGNNQKAALLSFAYNLGARFYNAQGFNTISRVLREKRWSDVPKAMYLYRNPGSNVEAGLARRRKAEGKLWETSD